MKYSTSDSSDSDLEDGMESNQDFFDMEMDESASVSDGTSNCSDVMGSDSSTVVGSNNGYFVALIPTVVNPPNDQNAPSLSYHHNVAIPRLNLNFGNYFHEVESAPSTFNGTRSADASTHAGHYSLPTTPHGHNSHHVQLAASLPATYTVFHHGGNVSLPMTPHEQTTRKCNYLFVLSSPINNLYLAHPREGQMDPLPFELEFQQQTHVITQQPPAYFPHDGLGFAQFEQEIPFTSDMSIDITSQFLAHDNS